MTGDVDEQDRGGTHHLPSNDGGRDVMVLGAGFSKAVDPRFPVTDELGQGAVDAAKLAPLDRFHGGTFEAWLSYLADSQPFLSQAESLANRALFSRLVDAIHGVLCEIERRVVDDGLPRWLYQFVAALHSRRATVITFNYDRILERVLGDLRIADFSVGDRAELIQWFEPLDQIPSFPPNPTRAAGSTHPTFRLCKLHGSLNWFWVPGDTSGATLHHWELDDDPKNRPRYLPGREPFVVPPTSGKSALFSNPVMSETWRQAHQALLGADRVWFVGYSLPLTDLTSASMLSTSLSREDVTLEVVNTNPDLVIESVSRLTGRLAPGRQEVKRFAEDYVAMTSLALADRCRTAPVIDADARVVVGWNKSQIGRVRRASRSGATVTLHVAPFDGSATGLRYDANNTQIESSKALPMIDLVGLLHSGDSLEAEFAGGATSPLLGIDHFHTSTGATTNWRVLMPADHPSFVGVADP